MGIKINDFGQTKDKRKVQLVTLVNKNGMGIEVMDYGATLVAVTVPDRNGRLSDVVLGFDDAYDYSAKNLFFGATVGRNANRIGGAKVTISGKEYELDNNENGNNLHSGFHGYDKVIWKMEVSEEKTAVRFSHHGEAFDQGFPGNFDISVTYTLTDDNEIIIHYEGVSDADTIANMTNHSYFNLAGQETGDVLDQILWIDAEEITPLDQASVPTGEIRNIRGTCMDFTTPKKIGRDIEDDYDQLNIGAGYDHNYVLKQDGKLHKFAEAYDEKSGRVMEAFTDCVGVQFYTGNYIDANCPGKDGAVYQRRSGFCLETNYYADANHHDNFPSSILKAGEKYDTTTIYKFSTR